MTPQELKNSILQLAFEGKLVFNSKENSESLIKEISQFKVKKRIKTKKYESINFVKKPFELPENWRWVYLSDIASINGGYAFKSVDYKDDGVRIVRISDFNENGFINNKIVRTDFSTDIVDYKIELEDILLCMTGGTVGKSYFVKELKEDMYTNQRVATIKIFNPQKNFIYYAILAPFTQKVINDSKNSTNDNISMDLINTFLIPLPPLEEQKRIVAKIEELLPLVDKYEEAWTKLEKFNIKFPAEMEKSILNHAFEGKLVKQNPEIDGSADELYSEILLRKSNLHLKVKKEKNSNDIQSPYQIPSNWKWCKWGDLAINIQYGYNAPAKETGLVKMLRISDIQENKVDWFSVPFCDISEKEINDYLLKENDILFARTGGTVGKSFIIKNVTEKAIFAGYLIRTQYFDDLIVPMFLKYFMGTDLYWKQLRSGTIATAQPNCNGQTLSQMLIPLPPLNEQKRIVAKIKELLPLCRSLK